MNKDQISIASFFWATGFFALLIVTFQATIQYAPGAYVLIFNVTAIAFILGTILLLSALCKFVERVYDGSRSLDGLIHLFFIATYLMLPGIAIFIVTVSIRNNNAMQ